MLCRLESANELLTPMEKREIQDRSTHRDTGNVILSMGEKEREIENAGMKSSVGRRKTTGRKVKERK